MSKIPFWTGGSGLNVIRLLGVIAFGLAGLSVTAVLGQVSANTASQSTDLSAFRLVEPGDTVTPTATITGTQTLTVTLTPTLTPTPGTPAPSGTPDKVTICHRTGSQNNPYVMISVSRNAIPAHTAHGDIIPAPAGGCPAFLTPGATRTVTATTTPAATTTTTTTPAASPSATGTVTAKVTICHRTGATKNRYVMITVSTSAIPAHTGHGDLIPAPAGGCPAVAPSTTTKKANPGHSNGSTTNRGNGNGNGNAQPPGQQNNNKGGGEGKGNGNGHGKNK